MAVVLDEKVPDIHLYTEQTPNGIKISITLEELKCVRLNRRCELSGILILSQSSISDAPRRYSYKRAERTMVSRNQSQRSNSRLDGHLHRWQNDPALRVRLDHAVSG